MDRFEIHKSMATVALKLITLQIITSFIYPVAYLIIDYLTQNSALIDIISIVVVLIIIINIINLTFIAYIIIYWSSEKYIIYPDKIKYVSGIFIKKTFTWELDNVKSMHIDENLIGRLLNYGSITLQNPLLDEDIIIENISSPKIILEKIEENLPKTQNSRIIYTKKTKR